MPEVEGINFILELTLVARNKLILFQLFSAQLVEPRGATRRVLDSLEACRRRIE